MVKNIKVSEPDENYIRYLKIEVNEEEGIEENREIPENKAKNNRKKKSWVSEDTKEMLIWTGTVVGPIGLVAGIITGAVLLSDYLCRKSFREGSYQCSFMEWKLKSVVGEDYVKFDSNGTLEIYRPNPFLRSDNDSKQIEFIDSNLDGLVDEIIIYKGNGNSDRIVRGKDNSKVFEKADRKYRHYKEELADLIAKAEQAWREQ